MTSPRPRYALAKSVPASAPTTERWRFARALSVIAVVALLFRLGALLWIPTLPVSDAWAYIDLAKNLVEEGGYQWGHGAQTAYLAPGYPLLLAAVFAVVGPSLVAVKATNLMLSLATVVLGGLAARVLLGGGAALAAAGVLCVDPRQILLVCLSASEHLGSPMLFAFLWLLGLSWRRPRALVPAAVAGLLLGVSALARPIGLFAWLLWPICGLLARKPRVAVLLETAAMLACLSALLLPWGLRNERMFGRFTMSTTTTGINLFMGNNDVANGTWVDWRPLLDRLRPETIDAHEGIVDAVAADEARRWIAAHPARAALGYIDKLRMYFFWWDYASVAHWTIFARDTTPPLPPGAALPGQHVLKQNFDAVYGTFAVQFFVLLALAVLGAARLLRRALRDPAPPWRSSAVALVGLALYFPAITAVFIVVDRYRWPMEDVLALLAAFALSGTCVWLRAARRR